MKSLKEFNEQELSKEMMSRIQGGTVSRLMCTDVNTGGLNYYFYNNESGSLRDLLGVSISFCDVENCGCGPQQEAKE